MPARRSARARRDVVAEKTLPPVEEAVTAEVVTDDPESTEAIYYPVNDDDDELPPLLEAASEGSQEGEEQVVEVAAGLRLEAPVVETLRNLLMAGMPSLTEAQRNISGSLLAGIDDYLERIKHTREDAL